MVVVALQSMSPSRQGIHVEAYCARLVVEGCDVPMQNHSGGQQSNRVLHEEDGRSFPTQLTRDLVERREVPRAPMHILLMKSWGEYYGFFSNLKAFGARRWNFLFKTPRHCTPQGLGDALTVGDADYCTHMRYPCDQRRFLFD